MTLFINIITSYRPEDSQEMGNWELEIRNGGWKWEIGNEGVKRGRGMDGNGEWGMEIGNWELVNGGLKWERGMELENWE